MIKRLTGKIPLMLIFLALFGGVAWADKLYLKDGEVFEGKLLSETDTEVKFQVSIGSIKETRTFPKSEVDRVEKPKPDDVDIVPIRGLLPVRDLAEADVYRSATKLTDAFLTKYPDSPHVEEVKKIDAQLEEEMAKVLEGQRQFKGEWLSAAEVRMHSGNIEAARLHDQMIAYASRGGRANLTGSLRVFEKLRTDYEGTRAYPEAVGTAIQILNAYGQALTSKKNEIVSTQKYREEQRARMTEVQKQQVDAAIARENAEFRALVEREEAADIKWLSTSNRSVENLEDTIEQVLDELEDLKKLDLELIRERADKLYEVESLLAKNEVAKAEEAMKAAAKIKSRSKENAYLADLKGKLTKAEEDLAKQVALDNLNKSPESSISGSSGSGSSEGDTSKEDALRLLNSSGGSSTASVDTEETKPKPKPKPTTEKKETKPEPKSDPQPTPTVATNTGGGFNPIIPIAGVLIIATTVVYFMQKKKGGAS